MKLPIYYQIAHESHRFLELAYLASIKSDNPGGISIFYDTEIIALHDTIGQCVSSLLEDNANSVKQTLMTHSVQRLGNFFGKPKANDILFSHMITFLNDKEDPQLRDSFYRSIRGVASFIGQPCSAMLKPLLLQVITS